MAGCAAYQQNQIKEIAQDIEQMQENHILSTKINTYQ